MKCWPGCRAQVIDHPINKGVIVITLKLLPERSEPTWIVRTMATAFTSSGTKIPIFSCTTVRDSSLTPLNHIADKEVEAENFIIRALANPDRKT